MTSLRRSSAVSLAIGLSVAALTGACAKSEPSTASTDAPAAAATDFGAKGRRVVQLIVAGELAKVREDFDSTMKAGLPEQRMREGWSQFQSLYGTYESQVEPEVLKRGSISVVNIPLTMDRGRGQARISFRPDGKIAGLFFLRPGVPVP